MDELDAFIDSTESENIKSIKKDEENSEIEAIVEKILKIKTFREDENKATKEKTIGFLYQHSISFLPTDKIGREFPISKKFCQP